MDKVSNPKHYTQGGIECIDAIYAALGHAGFLSYCQGNIVKYIWRYKNKDGVDDLRKAQVYLEYMINKLSHLGPEYHINARR